MPDATGQPLGAVAPRRRRRWRRLLVAIAVAAVALLAAGAWVSWHFASQVLVPDRGTGPYDVAVHAVAPGQVTLARTTGTLRRGIYGLNWKDGGHAIVGRVLREDQDAVTRTLHAVRGRLAAGTKVRVEPDVYAGTPWQTRRLAYRSVAVPDPLGPMPAWQLGGGPGTWAIVVHGINGSRAAGLRIAPALRRAGLPALLISYRDDAGAPASPDGLHHLGLTEWEDLEAAARYALAHGARDLVLVGSSMGGAIVAQFMERSPLARRVRGLVLDAPALSWKPIFAFNARELHLPSFAAVPVEWAIGARIDVDWDRLDALRHTAAFRLPILLFHGTADRTVPIATSDAFARALPDHVTELRVPGAGHVEAWNVHPARYDARLTTFLANIGAVGRPGGARPADRLASAGADR